MFRAENARQFIDGLDDWMDECEALADGVLRGLAVVAFEDIVTGTAQWSGNMAASWTLSTVTPNVVSETPFKDIEPPRSGPLGESEYRRGSAPAVNYALTQARADGVDRLIRLGVPVFICTGVPYAEAVETDTHEAKKIKFLRGVNLPAEVLQRAAARVERRGEITLPVALSLAARFV